MIWHSQVSRAAPRRLGPRTYLLGGIAALSTFDPTLATVLAGVTAIVILAFGDLRKQRIPPSTGWMAALVGWVALSGAWSVNPYSLNVTLTWCALGLLFVAGGSLVQTTTQLRAIAVGYLLGAFLAVVRLVLENPSMLGADPSARVTTVFDDVNVNYLAYALVTGFALVVFLWVTAPQKTLRTKVSLVATAAALVLGVEMTQSRGALLGIICAAIWLVLRRLFRIRTLVPMTIALVIASTVIVSGLADQPSLQFEAGDRATGTWSGRIPLWESARELWALNPIIGYGASGFAFASDHMIAAHNVILDLAVGLGSIGVLLFIGLIRAALWTGTRKAPMEKRTLLIGTFIAASAPAYLTGAWVTAPAAWLALVLFSRIDVLRGTPTPTPELDSKSSTAIGPTTRAPGYRRALAGSSARDIDTSGLWNQPVGDSRQPSGRPAR